MLGHSYLQMIFLILLLFPRIHGSPLKAIDLLSKGEVDNQCFDMSLLALVETKHINVVENVQELWKFLMYLRESRTPQHRYLFWDLAQLFWDIYVDCVLGRTHGLGKRKTIIGKNIAIQI